jgi:hypothetical protein
MRQPGRMMASGVNDSNDAKPWAAPQSCYTKKGREHSKLIQRRCGCTTSRDPDVWCRCYEEVMGCPAGWTG